MTNSDKPKHGPLRLIRRLLVGTVLVISVLLAPLVVVMTYGINVPDWMRQSLETRLNAAVAPFALKVGRIEVTLFAEGLNPSVSVNNVRLLDEDQKLQVALPQISSVLSGADLIFGRIKPVRLNIDRARLNMRRDSEGRIDISMAGDPDEEQNAEQSVEAEQNLSPSEIVANLEKVFERPFLDKLEQVTSAEMSVLLIDDLTERTWDFHNGSLSMDNRPTDLAVTMTFQLLNPTAEAASASFSLTKVKGVAQAEFSSRFSGFRTKDVADQVAALNWLRVLKAPISGSVSLTMQTDGSFGDLYGVLDIGAGQLVPGGETKPVRFKGAKAYLTYAKAEEKLTFNQISIDTDAGRLEAEGHAYISDRIDRTVGAVIGQLKINKLLINPEGVFEDPVRFDLGAIDLRVRFDPFEADLGQMVLLDRGTKFKIAGKIAADAQGWSSSLDLSINAVSRDYLLKLWPLPLISNTRTWLETNFISGDITNVKGAFRVSPNEKPRASIGFNIENGSVRYIKTLPPLEQASGYGVLTESRLDLVIDQGLVVAPEGGAVNVAGSTFSIPDITIIPANAEIKLITQSSITAMLSILDQPPFEFLTKASMTPDLAEGTARAEGKITLPLAKGVTFDQVGFEANGTLTAVRSETLVKGKTVKANSLTVYANTQGVTVSGDAVFGKTQVSGAWTQKFGPEHKGTSRLEGQIEVSAATLDEFGIPYPEDAVVGKGSGAFSLEFKKGKPPQFALVSDLNRVQVRIDAIGWRKAKNSTGRLDIKGRLASPAKIDLISLKAKGIEVSGQAKLKKDGTLDVVELSKVEVGGWLKSSIFIRPAANGAGVYTIKGGSIDLRYSRFASSAGGSVANQINVDLDRITLSSGITLTEVKGDLNTSGGLSGSFSGLVNGGAPVVGILAPQSGGTAVRFTSNDAGAVLRSSGLFKTAYGGRMDLILTPGEAVGQYLGALAVQQTRVRKAPALAELLSAISVIGLLEQLGGDGIAFSTIDARFLLTEKGVSLTQSSAVGASMGITMQGAYDSTAATMDMQGVITPIYVLNGLLEQTKIFGGLFGKQKGEGLFGFNYTLKGPVEDPKVGVNPLSILTPGLFREIFRAPVPKVPE